MSCLVVWFKVQKTFEAITDGKWCSLKSTLMQKFVSCLCKDTSAVKCDAEDTVTIIWVLLSVIRFVLTYCSIQARSHPFPRANSAIGINSPNMCRPPSHCKALLWRKGMTPEDRTWRGEFSLSKRICHIGNVRFELSKKNLGGDFWQFRRMTKDGFTEFILILPN